VEGVVEVLKLVGATALLLAYGALVLLLGYLWSHARCVNRSSVLAQLRDGRAAARRSTCPTCKRRGLVWRREVWCEGRRDSSDDSTPERGYILHCPACRRAFALDRWGNEYKLSGSDHRGRVERAKRSSRAVAERRARRTGRCT
jgi:hypothetical protein